MKIARTTVRIIAVLALLVVGVVALNWRQLLTPEQKLRYGMTFEAAEELRELASKQSGTDSPAAQMQLNRYVNALVLEGNFGRAFYLIDLYGAKYTGPGADELPELRTALAEAQKELLSQRAYEVRKLPAGQAWKDMDAPAYQALLYLDGYRHATLGDWATAKNLLGAVETKRLAPPLRPYHLYFLARAYRLTGSEEEKAQVPALQKQLLASDGGRALKARGTYNLIAWHIGKGEVEAAQKLLAELDAKSEDEHWAYQKAALELANHYWGEKQGKDAWVLASEAMLAAPDDRAARAASDMLILCARAELTGKLPDGSAVPEHVSGKFDLPIEQGLLAAWGKNAGTFGGAVEVQALLKQLAGKLPDASAADLLLGRATISAAAGDAPAISALIASPVFAAAPVETRAEVRFLLAKVLHAKQQWNAALEQYRIVAELNSTHKAEALLGRYLVLKAVQEPLDLEVAVPLLEDCIGSSQTDETAEGFQSMVKAFEELIPLLISQNYRSAAQKFLGYDELIPDRTDDLSTAGLAKSTKSIRKWRALQAYWKSYLDTAKGPTKSIVNWSYYELARAKELAPAKVGVEIGGDTAADYLAGLGLGAEAKESLLQNAIASQAQLYNSLWFHDQWYDLPRKQWEATELLESGELRDDIKVVEHVLSLAYPTPYRELVDKAAKQFGVDAALIYAVMKKESNFKSKAVSSVGATGLLQLMPPTARMMANAHGLPLEPLKEPEVNIPLGAAYLKNLQSELAGKIAPPGPGESEHDALLRATLHSYNAGPGNYSKWRGQYPNADATLLTDLIPNEENEEFGKRVWKYYLIYKWRLGQE